MDSPKCQIFDVFRQKSDTRQFSDVKILTCHFFDVKILTRHFSDAGVKFLTVEKKWESFVNF